jgi:hypothetical protein
MKYGMPVEATRQEKAEAHLTEEEREKKHRLEGARKRVQYYHALTIHSLWTHQVEAQREAREAKEQADRCSRS